MILPPRLMVRWLHALKKIESCSTDGMMYMKCRNLHKIIVAHIEKHGLHVPFYRPSDTNWLLSDMHQICDYLESTNDSPSALRTLLGVIAHLRSL
jgi:hypothetical protein